MPRGPCLAFYSWRPRSPAPRRVLNPVTELTPFPESYSPRSMPLRLLILLLISPSSFPSYETQEFFLAQVYTPTARENLRFPLQSPRSNVSHEEVPARYDRRDILQPTTKGKIYGKGDRY